MLAMENRLQMRDISAAVFQEDIELIKMVLGTFGANGATLDNFKSV